MGWYRDYYFLVELIDTNPEDLPLLSVDSIGLEQIPLDNDVRKILSDGGYTLPDEKSLSRCVILYGSEKKGDISWLLTVVTKLPEMLDGRARVLRAVTKHESEDCEVESYPIRITLEY